MTDPLLQRAQELPPNHPPPAPPTRPASRKRSGIPTKPASWLMLVILGLTSVAGDIAARGSAASVAGVLAVLGCCATIAAAEDRRRPEVLLPLALATLLGANLLIRTSPWVVIPTLLAIGGLLLLASQDRVLSSSPFLGLLVVVVWIENLFKVPVWIGGTASRSLTGNVRTLLAVARGLVVSVVVVLTLGLLLASGDAVFGSFLSEAIDGSLWSHVALVAVLFLLLSSLGVSSSRNRPLPHVAPFQPRATIEGFMGLAAMTAILGLWCGVQITVATGGADRILATEGLTRAEYARTGFFQLVFVAAVVIGLLSVLDRTTIRATPAARRTFAILSCVVAIETVVVVYATYLRLSLYIDAFGLTMLRLSVACFLAWLALVLGLVLMRVVGVGSGRRWTPMASLLLAVFVILGFGWVNPEAVVVRSNTGRSADLDVAYLTGLSHDAQPALLESLNNVNREDQQELTTRLCSDPLDERGYGILGWNRSVQSAIAARASLDCS